MIADKGLLVEHRPVAAEEAILGRRWHQPGVVLDGKADVEDLNKGKDYDRILVKNRLSKLRAEANHALC